MGCFSWLFADTDNTQNLRIDRAGYIACPDGTFIHEQCYEGYGEFNGQDVYELVVRWNRAFIAENPDFLLPHIHRFYDGSVKQYRLKDFRWYPVIADLSIPFEQLRDALDKHLRETVSLYRPYSAELRGVGISTLPATTRTTQLFRILSRLPGRCGESTIKTSQQVKGTRNREW